MANQEMVRMQIYAAVGGVLFPRYTNEDNKELINT